MFTKIGTSQIWDNKYTNAESEDIRLDNEVLDEVTNFVVEKSNYMQEYITTAISTIGMFLVGIHFSWIVPILPTLLSGTFKIHITMEESVWILSLLSIGAIPGSIIASMVSNNYGRKNAILLISIPYCVSSIIFIFASDVWHYYVARFISGLGCGASFAVLPMYVSEIASAEIRGLLCTSLIMSLKFGTLTDYILGAYLPIVMFAIICAIFPIIMFVLSFYLPETPYYHVMKQDLNLAEKSLKFLRKQSNVRDELNRLIEGYKEETSEKKLSFWDLFKDRTNLRSVIIITVLLMGQLWTGALAIFGYSQVMFEDGNSSISAEMGGILLALMNFVVAFICGSLLDRYGRRLLLFISGIMTILPLAILGGYFYLQDYTNFENIENLRLIPLIGILFFKFSIGIGLTGMPYVFLGELFPTSVKAHASSVVSIIGSVVGVAANKMYQVVYTEFDYPITFGMFIMWLVLIIIFIYFMVPETKGLTLEDIQTNLRKSNKK